MKKKSGLQKQRGGQIKRQPTKQLHLKTNSKSNHIFNKCLFLETSASKKIVLTNLDRPRTKFFPSSPKIFLL